MRQLGEVRKQLVRGTPGRKVPSCCFNRRKVDVQTNKQSNKQDTTSWWQTKNKTKNQESTQFLLQLENGVSFQGIARIRKFRLTDEIYIFKLPWQLYTFPFVLMPLWNVEFWHKEWVLTLETLKTFDGLSWLTSCPTPWPTPWVTHWRLRNSRPIRPWVTNCDFQAVLRCFYKMIFWSIKSSRLSSSIFHLIWQRHSRKQCKRMSLRREICQKKRQPKRDLCVLHFDQAESQHM